MQNKEITKKSAAVGCIASFCMLLMTIAIPIMGYTTSLFFSAEGAPSLASDSPFGQWLANLFSKENHRSLGRFLLIADLIIVAIISFVVFYLLSLSLQKSLFEKISRERGKNIKMLVGFSVGTIVILLLIGMFTWLFSGNRLNLFTLAGSLLGHPIFNILAIVFLICFACSLPRTIYDITRIAIRPTVQFFKDYDTFFIGALLLVGITIPVIISIFASYIVLMILYSAVFGVQIFFNDLVFAIKGKESMLANRIFAGVVSAAAFGVVASVIIPLFLKEAVRYA